MQILTAADTNHSRLLAAQSLGQIGPPARTAIPLLISLLADKADGVLRQRAAQSLGQMGPVARDAVPPLTALLTEPDESLRSAAARALGRIGFTPNGALPTLTAMKQSTNAWDRCAATLALWNRAPKDAGLYAELVAILHSEERGGLSSDLGLLGPKAAAFAPELRALLKDPEIWVRASARLALENIEPGSTPAGTL
jgi:HEAT repeat protein